MIEYFIGVDGGGTGTRVRLASADGTELAQGQGGPSGRAHGTGSVGHALLPGGAQRMIQLNMKGR